MSPSDQPPPEVLAIAVALAVLWPAASEELEAGAAADDPRPWRLAGRRWERATSHRWS
jgi:hypothetical protein